ncbi:hypothetical protein Q2K19_05090 [Micromonospora soli]|uniref:hypothetical protein n=1 Tax=Micromonospora sp. NBRC 110009 TaxID=3061627 RepID=UPI00267322FF|nr:hypothetical protein [Micromonospora sp. NBRC 110009]WKT99869.1 hypothetical protein Q2K19_05090 [Micromonospora sp. NBRC 110009]
MSVASKLQIKPGQHIVVLRKPDEVEIEGTSSAAVAEVAAADGAVVFVTAAADLATSEVEAVLDLARRDALAWVAYPKGGQLGTDLNRDRLAAALSQRGVQPVRQISVDATWSALRFRPAG